MKKFFVAFAVVIMLVQTGCFERVENSAKTNGQITASARTVDISDKINSDGSELVCEYDLDFDGNAEKINIRVEGEEANETVVVEMGNRSTSFGTDGAGIKKVYVCDIDISDGVLDVAVIIMQVSDDPCFYICKYDSSLTPYEFRSDDDAQSYDLKWLGYACSYYFNVNEDDTITLEEQTPNCGMWSVYKTYEQAGDGVFEEVVPEYYEILPDYMENMGMYTEFEYPEEAKKLSEGYVRAYSTVSYGDFTIYEGEYFKPYYDDGKRHIYIQKENGEGKWIDIEYNNPKRNELNSGFFMMAG